MPVGNVELVKLNPVKGIKIGITEAHVRYAGRKDLTVFDIICLLYTSPSPRD